jgi:phosphonate transport system substrate-binding protein
MEHEMRSFSRHVSWLVLLAVSLIVTLSCSLSDGDEPIFYLSGIPDQNIANLENRFDGLASYLSDETGLQVEYIPSVNYSAVVTAFKQGDIQLGWYGGLTGVQARLAAPGSVAIAQRPRDAEFHSVFIAAAGSGVYTLEDVKGKSLSFGSESSTSGHLMPRFFLGEAGVDVDSDLAGAPNYSGSHDKTWKLVETGAFDVGVLNEAVWDKRVEVGDVDLSAVDVFLRTPPYFDYHWIIHGDVDEKFGKGASGKIAQALLQLSIEASDREKSIVEAFQTDRFIETSNKNYESIERVARELGIVR